MEIRPSQLPAADQIAAVSRAVQRLADDLIASGIDPTLILPGLGMWLGTVFSEGGESLNVENFIRALRAHVARDRAAAARKPTA